MPLIAAACAVAAGCGGAAKEHRVGSWAHPEPLPFTESEYRIEPANARVDPGVYAFAVKNAGRLPHLLEIEGPGLESETAEIPPGKTKSLTIRLPPGTYELFSSLDHDARRGMRAPLRVGPAGG